LLSKIREGGQGVWGQVPMPPNPGLTDDELQRLVNWLLGR
jgi:cytochrome c